MAKVAIFGAGQIGQAVYRIITDLKYSVVRNNPYADIDAFVIDSDRDNIQKLTYGFHFVVDLNTSSIDDLFTLLINQGVTHVINALPFSFNEKVASAAISAKCNYIDFTEDDIMADKVQEIYKNSDLICAVKCGLAPGFINYIGYDLVSRIEIPDSLMISVGALPRMVSYDVNHPEHSYNLTWSIDGLVNEYIRPCRIRKDGKEKEVHALGGLAKVILDGVEYEAAFTSGGVGSLVKELTNLSNIQYMTLRYPGHYKYVRAIVQENHGDFNKIKKILTETFSYTDDDVIVVYADAHGKDSSGKLTRRSYYNKFYGVNGLTGIQSTTAGSGVAMLELMLNGKIQGSVNHSEVSLADFMHTTAFKKYYNTSK